MCAFCLGLLNDTTRGPVARLADGAQYNVGDKASFRFASLGFGFWVYPLKYYNCLMGYEPKSVRFA